MIALLVAWIVMYVVAFALWGAAVYVSGKDRLYTHAYPLLFGGWAAYAVGTVCGFAAAGMSS